MPNKSLIPPIKNFLEHAVICAEPSLKSVTITQKKMPLIVKGIFFKTDEEFNSLLREAISKIYKQIAKTHITEKEISSILTKAAADQVREKTDQSTKVLESLNSESSLVAKIILPNHSVFLSDNLESFQIGPVNFIRTEALQKLEPLITNEIIISDIGQPANPSDPLEFTLPSQCVLINLGCSQHSAHNLAQWYLDIVHSLLRFFIFKTDSISGHFPYLGDLDPLTFSARERGMRYIQISENPNESHYYTSSGTSPFYHIDGNIAERLNSSDLKSTTDKLFSAKNNHVAARLIKSLGWLSKARKSHDLPTRFLFFFTALEAVFTQEQGVPITETIARYTATAIGKIEFRERIYANVKRLYGIRSQLVHSGNNDVLESECELLQYYVEMICGAIMSHALNDTNEAFLESLKSSSFGFPWKEAVTT